MADEARRATWAPWHSLSWTEHRRRSTEILFELEKALCDEGHSDLVHNAGANVLRFEDVRFPLSRRHADRRGLEELGYYVAGSGTQEEAGSHIFMRTPERLR